MFDISIELSTKTMKRLYYYKGIEYYSLIHEAKVRNNYNLFKL